MSITGSLVGYENNNEINICKKTTTNRSLLNITTTSTNSIVKPCPSLNSSISNSIITTASSNISNHTRHHEQQHHVKYQNNSNRKSLQRQQQQHHQQQMHQHQHHQNNQQSYLHLNSLWSIWYGVLVTLFQGYLAVHGAYRFLGCSLIQWKIEPVVELNIQIVMCGFAFVLLPLFFASAVFKVGNLANDGIKLATMGHSKCSASPHEGLEEESKGSTFRALWTHGGPTAAFVHIMIALCLLLPRLLLEARIIENGLLPRENIWRNELDFLVTNRDRLVVLSFMTSPYQNISTYNETSWEDESNATYSFLNKNNNNKNINYNNKKSTIEHKQKMYPKTPFYERTDLIEKFRPDNEFFESHENLEIDILGTLPSSSSSSSSSSSLSSSSSASSLLSIPTMSSRTTRIMTETSKIIRPQLTTSRISSLSTPSSIATTIRTSKSIRNNESQKNGGRQNKKRKEQQSNKSNRNEDRKIITTKYDDINYDLELKPDRTIDFSRLNEFEMSTIFESSSNTKSRSGISAEITSTEPFMKRPTTQQTTKASLRDSEIHIVKPERLPEIIPSTAISTNSKIIEIKTKKVKRMTYETEVGIEPESLVGAVPANISSAPIMIRLDGFAGMLQKFFRVEKEIDVTSFSHPPSMEFLNLVLALMVWSVRYPAVFWSTTKPFASVFSFQMVVNTIDIILGYTGVSTLYKLQIVGQVLPIQGPALLLNAVVTLSLFILSTILVIASSLVLYLYGHGRLAARIRDRCMITVKNSETWIYFAHCASLCIVLALAVVKAPIMHDLSATYRGSLDGSVLSSALGSVIHLFLWIVLWLVLTAKRRWTFKLPPLEQYGIASGVTQPLLISTRGHLGGGGSGGGNGSHGQSDSKGISTTSSTDGVEDTIYWPKLTPSSPKLKVTFNEVTSTSEDVLIIGGEHDGKRNTSRGATLCIASIAGEADDGDYATLRGGGGGIGIGNGGGVGGCIGGNANAGGNILHLSEYDELPPPPAQLLPPSSCNGGIIGGCDFVDDNTSEEGKLLACVRDDSVTYASTRDLEPPHPPPSISSAVQSPIMPQHPDMGMNLGSPDHLISPLAPVTVTVHTNEIHIPSTSTPRCLRRADSGVPNEALTPRSDTTSTTESTTSPPERAPSETSSGVHSGEEREEVVIRPRAVCKAVPKPPPPAIIEEPFGRSTNMKMSSFNNDGKSSATLPLTRNAPEPRLDYSHCSTMPLPMGCHQIQYKPQAYTPTASKQQIMHTTLPNGVRYSNPHFLRRIPHVTKAESPYGHLGLGAGHHTFSKLLQDPLHSLASTTIPEDRDSANYSMISDQDRDCVYANTQRIN